jgi:S-adenosylmethionine:tRNA ribosyltransferase-isomerase
MNSVSNRLKTADFSYHLPEHLIAQSPNRERDSSRLLFLAKRTGEIRHGFFSDLPSHLAAGDRLIFNDTKVFPARLWVHKKSGARIELLFINKINELTWIVCMRNARRTAHNTLLYPDDDPDISIQVIEIMGDGNRIVQLRPTAEYSSFDDLLDRLGEVPLPPYIHRKPLEEDRSRYQTIYAEKRGAVAAPTAGLHFTETVLHTLRQQGIDFSFVTLHVGLGTFQPVKTEDPADHVMHTEHFEVSQEVAQEIEQTRSSGGRIIAIGTTVVRVLEHCAAAPGRIQSGRGTTQLKILPGYEFRIIDGMVTNFHMPESTLLMLVCACAGTQSILHAYAEAVQRQYRFFSYGDAMLIL